MMQQGISVVRARFHRTMKVGSEVIAKAAALTNFSAQSITGQWRETQICRVRWAIMRTMREQGHSLLNIGYAMGNRDHTTVLHGLKRAEALYASDDAFRALCEALAA